MNLGSEPYDYDGGKRGCKPCNLFNSYFLKTDKNQQTATSSNSTELNKHTFKYMTACTQVRRECEDTTFNQGFKSDKSKNLLGCSACYSENKIKNRTSNAVCQVRRYCSQADQNGTGRNDNAYSRYKGFDTGNVEYSCACEQLSTNVPGLPYNFKYCQNLIGNYCPSSKSNSTTTTKDYTIKIPSSHVNKEVYNLRRVKDNSNNYRNEDQIVEYEPYNPVAGNLSTKEGKLSPYFLPEKCETNNGFKCEVTGYNYSAQTFTIRVHMQTKCTKTCSGDDWKKYGACKMCAQTASYSCTKNGKPSTCTKCVAWKSNGRCMRKEAVNDTLSKVTLYYTYADPLCSRKFSPIPIPCTSCECMETGGLDTCTVCGSCSDDKKQNTCTNPGSEQVACSNPACNTPTYDVGDNKKCEETKENSIKLNRPFVIGDAYNPLSTDRDWLKGKEGYYVGGDPMSKYSEKSNCRSEEFNVSELGLTGVDASKITEVLSCTLSSGDTYGQDWLSGSGTYSGVYKTICGYHSQSCSVTGKKKVTITMCTKYHTYSCSTPTSSGVIDYDDWGIASLKLKYKIKTSD